MTLDAFETFLKRPAPYLAGIDAPFGQARTFLAALGLDTSWTHYVTSFAGQGKEAFAEAIYAYMRGRPPGQKEQKRQVDRQAKALSPMRLSVIPVGRMFFELAPRLERNPFNLPLLRPTPDERTVLETYPALVVRGLIGKSPYKNDNAPSGAFRTAQRRVLDALATAKAKEMYGFHIRLTDAQREVLTHDPKADGLDALLCALQVAWASAQPNYGISPDADALEGWICDPSLQSSKGA